MCAGFKDHHGIDGVEDSRWHDGHMRRLLLAGGQSGLRPSIVPETTSDWFCNSSGAS